MPTCEITSISNIRTNLFCAVAIWSIMNYIIYILSKLAENDTTRDADNNNSHYQILWNYDEH